MNEKRFFFQSISFSVFTITFSIKISIFQKLKFITIFLMAYRKDISKNNLIKYSLILVWICKNKTKWYENKIKIVWQNYLKKSILSNNQEVDQPPSPFRTLICIRSGYTYSNGKWVRSLSEKFKWKWQIKK